MIAIGRPKGGSYGKSADAESGEAPGADSSGYEAVGKDVLEAVESGDAAAVGDAIRKAVMRCMAEEGGE